MFHAIGPDELSIFRPLLGHTVGKAIEIGFRGSEFAWAIKAKYDPMCDAVLQGVFIRQFTALVEIANSDDLLFEDVLCLKLMRARHKSGNDMFSGILRN